MLHRVDGDLYMEQVSLTEIAEQHGTPTYIYSETAIRSAYEAFDSAFATHPHTVCYAVKACSNISILQLLAELGAGFDIVSGGELTRVLRAGGEARRVVFSGVGKQNWEIEYALTSGIGCLNIESASELQRVASIAAAKQLRAPVSVRVNPDVDPKTHPYIATGLKENKFGVSATEALAMYQQAAKDPWLDIVGIDCHIGSQITELEPFLDALRKLLELCDELESQGIEINHLDLGGGLGVRYRDEEPLDTESFAAAITQSMSGRPQSLLFEPGRIIVANAGLLLTRVNTLKSNEDRNFAVIDAAMNDLIRPALYGAWQEVTPVHEHDQDRKSWDIVGPVCETGDFLAKDREICLEENDLLAILSAGAYGFVMSSNYNSRGRAAEILVTGSEHRCIRRRETIEDQLALESLRRQ
ncbi:MAG: diaminopimelate decarboxylase [Gammaproteobacteria bacterium]|jgi:diaminopimelate decarboxylase|nr:diaminopimelate decarboxylase [Gammaproteobacteria bacterium]MBT4494645.1 diaminopimelate decarboxylase [Gammaproteobacteria bacterium]MBT7369742.1 diaminopimelate decarboxylase [Gammaproteobacteria bacterium]